MNTDRIVKTVILKASRQRVWEAITDSRSFGTWFGVELDGPFVAGRETTGRIVPTQVDAEVAKRQESFRGTPWRAQVARLEPMNLFSFHWHPYAVDPTSDYSREPMTLVTFELQDAQDGILLTITESGFERLPAARRAQALESNTLGWGHQTRLIEKYLALETRA
jgi:uncharacterized protein YndB with AHSA1/START domain